MRLIISRSPTLLGPLSIPFPVSVGTRFYLTHCASYLSSADAVSPSDPGFTEPVLLALRWTWELQLEPS